MVTNYIWYQSITIYIYGIYIYILKNGLQRDAQNKKKEASKCAKFLCSLAMFIINWLKFLLTSCVASPNVAHAWLHLLYEQLLISKPFLLTVPS